MKLSLPLIDILQINSEKENNFKKVLTKQNLSDIILWKAKQRSTSHLAV